MKSFKFLAVAGLAAAALMQSAAAQTTIYVTGSTAYRSAAQAAISALLGVATFDASDSSAPSGPKNSTFEWTNHTYADTQTGVNVTNVTVKATFTGSASGVASVAANGVGIAVPFLPDNSTGNANLSAYTDSQGQNPRSGYPTHIPDFAFADVFQASTPFNRAVDASLNDSIVGIVAFKWIASHGFNGGVGLSVEPNFLGYLFTAGKAPLSFLSGVVADQKKIIFAVGRNPDSGTRITAFADSKIGINTVVSQYQANPPTDLTAANQTVTSQALYPIETINGISTGSSGNSGQASGGTLSNYMSATLPNSGLTGMNGTVTYTGAYYLTYLGLSDSTTALTATNAGVELPYKGVTLGQPQNFALIQQGHYTFWGYEHIDDNGVLGNGNTNGDFEQDTINQITAATTSLAGVGGHDDASMQVKRATDGATIKIKNFAF